MTSKPQTKSKTELTKKVKGNSNPKTIIPKPKAAPKKIEVAKVKSTPIIKQVSKPKTITNTAAKRTKTLVLTTWLIEVKNFLESLPKDPKAQNLLQGFLNNKTKKQ